MIVKKITTGFVIQSFDTKQKRFTSQEFVAGECAYEDEKGEPVDPHLIMNEYLPFAMLQPDRAPGSPASQPNKGFEIHELGSTYADASDRFVVSLIVTYSSTDKDDPKTVKEAVAAALSLTMDESSADTHWYCYDRAQQKIRMIEQSEVQV